MEVAKSIYLSRIFINLAKFIGQLGGINWLFDFHVKKFPYVPPDMHYSHIHIFIKREEGEES